MNTSNNTSNNISNNTSKKILSLISEKLNAFVCVDNFIRLFSLLALLFCVLPIYKVKGYGNMNFIKAWSALKVCENAPRTMSNLYILVLLLTALTFAVTFIKKFNYNIIYGTSAICIFVSLIFVVIQSVSVNKYLVEKTFGEEKFFELLPSFTWLMLFLYMTLMFAVGGVLDLEERKNKFLKIKVSDAIFNGLNITFFALFTFICFFPFYYLFINTISDNALVGIGQIKFYPRGIHFENYKNILHVNELPDALLVSVSRTVLGTVTMVVASAFIGYLVTKQEMWGRKVIYRILIITMYFNAGIIPWYLNMSMLGLTNNFWAYIIPGIVAPYNIILVKTYIESIPAELEESAAIDGAGYLRIFASIIWPLSKPILATIAIFGAVGQWNSFTDSMILMQNAPKLYSLQYRLYLYLNSTTNLAQQMSQGGAISDAIANSLNNRTISLTVSMVTMIPIILVYPFMQRYFVKGMMIGAVKG